MKPNWNYSVSLKELQVPTGGKLQGRLATVDDETGQILGTVSPRYNLIQNRTLHEAMTEVGEQMSMKLNKVEVCSARRFTVFNYSLGEDRDITIEGSSTTEDKIRFGFHVVNTFDSRLGPGYFRAFANRLVCLNGLVVPKEIRKFSFREVNFFNDPVTTKNRLQLQLTPIFNTAKTWSAWAKAIPNRNRIEDFLTTGFSKKTTKKLMKSYDESADHSIWGLYNVLTYHITHDATCKNPENLQLKQWDLENRISKLYKKDLC